MPEGKEVVVSDETTPDSSPNGDEESGVSSETTLDSSSLEDGEVVVSDEPETTPDSSPNGDAEIYGVEVVANATEPLADVLDSTSHDYTVVVKNATEKQQFAAAADDVKCVHLESCDLDELSLAVTDMSVAYAIIAAGYARATAQSYMVTLDELVPDDDTASWPSPTVLAWGCEYVVGLLDSTDF